MRALEPKILFQTNMKLEPSERKLMKIGKLPKFIISTITFAFYEEICIYMRDWKVFPCFTIV